LIRHELIKALRNFKLSPVSPLPSSNHHESCLNNETIIVRDVHGSDLTIMSDYYLYP
jgi:hypothetical protein